MQIYEFKGVWPEIASDVFLAPGSVVIGDVVIGAHSSIWFQTVIRGDVHYIRIGEGTNVQDCCALHVTSDKFPLEIGNLVTIGHRATVHGCIVGDNCLIGMGATIMDGAVIGEGSVIAAGSLVTPGTEIPPGSMVMGSPGRVKRSISEEEKERIRSTSQHYIELARIYRGSMERSIRKGF